MLIPLPCELNNLARLFEGAGATLYAVGGAVRNALLGLPLSDMDITSALRYDKVEALCEENGIFTMEKGAAFGTLDIVMGGTRFEYACFREDTYAPGGSHRPKGVGFVETAEADAFRRDFTVNALYYDILRGEITDPTGGLADIEKKVIRATSPDPAHVLGDDALRILRMVRFAGELGFTVDEATFAAARENVHGLEDISPERIRAELDKILLCDARYGLPAERVLFALESLDRLGAFEEFIPEAALCRGLAQRRDYHRYDVLSHTLHAVASAPQSLKLRLAMLFHDLGKPEALELRGQMHEHADISARMAREIMGRLRYPLSLTEEVCALVAWHMFDLEGKAREDTLRKRFSLLGRERSRELCLIREADVHGSGIITGEVESAVRWRAVLDKMEREGAPFGESELKCTGLDIEAWLSIPPCRRVGEVKRALLLHCAVHPADNRPENLRRVARDIGRGNA